MLIKIYLLTSLLLSGSDNMKICGVKFKDFGKEYHFKYDGLNLKKNLTVVVETEKGLQFAKVSTPSIDDAKIDVENLKQVIRISTKSDYNDYLKNLKDAKEATSYATKLAKESKLDMKFIDGSFTLDRKQLILNFLSDDRVDFRNIAKDLAAKYKARIELHQLGVRDRARECGGLGQCGRELCCKGFLNGSESISINMAKNQNIALNPSKINGVCGRLLCCLAYEDDVYYEHRKKLPKIGENANTPHGTGRVVSLDVLNKKYTVEIDGNKYDIEQD